MDEPINEVEKTVILLSVGHKTVKHEHFYRNIQMNENVYLWIHIYFCL